MRRVVKRVGYFLSLKNSARWICHCDNVGDLGEARIRIEESSDYPLAQSCRLGRERQADASRWSDVYLRRGAILLKRKPERERRHHEH
jgi:hypothetical protein